MNLLVAELQRLWARRITRFFPLILAVLVIVGVVIAYFVIKANDFNVDFVDDLAASEGPNGEGSSVLGPIGGFIPVMGFVIGASFFGADLKAGMIEQLLTWEPRRIRFLGTRVVAGFVTLFVITVALSIFFVAMMFLLASLVGTTDGTTSDLWLDIGAAVLRSGIVGGIFFIVGLGITTLVNSSVGSIVGFVIYWFVIESILISAFLPKVAVWLPVTNANAFANGVDVDSVDGFFSDSPEFFSHHGYVVAGLILLAWGLGFLALAAIAFDRRDVD